MRGLANSLLLFRNEFNKNNNTGARILDLKITVSVKTFGFCHIWRTKRCNGRHFITLLNM